MDMKGDGFDLFMRFADGCRCYLQSKGVISREDNQAILDYFKTGKKPDSDVLKRVYYVAFPGLEVVGERLGKRMFDADVVRKFYAFDHNKMKVEQGNYVCIAFPAKILEKRDSEYLLELSPVKGNFCIDSDLDLKPGDWVIVHRMNVVEKVSEEYAKNISDNLKRLGVDKEMRFPEKAIKYLKELKRNA
ncbi:MAG: HypC/HybG/HupF family hydrogenase formation chaperone [Candidatus Aenigmatarchaeota archaeon]|nr:MAG: HypC/HybG/HupF family hydrogenase formation chaperone [Candidatus Aenigmarchaeota archaeon]